MTRGNTEFTQVVYKGSDGDSYIVMIDSPAELQKWKKDQSIPLSQVLSAWKIFTNHKSGAQGILDTASNAQLDTEFGTHTDDAVIKKILSEGSPQVRTYAERQGDKNITDGGLVAH